MLWDKTGKSWAQLGVPGQPAWMLLDKTGTIVAASAGEIPYSAVLDEVAALS